MTATAQWGLVVYIVAAALALGIGEWINYNTRCNALRRSVFANLDSAYENGYFEPGEHLDGMSAGEVVLDMLMYAEDLQGNTHDDIAPYVHEWMEAKGLS